MGRRFADEHHVRRPDLFEIDREIAAPYRVRTIAARELIARAIGDVDPRERFDEAVTLTVHGVIMSTSSFLFLLLIGLWLPLAAWRSSQRLGTGPVPLTPSKFFLNIIATQLFLLLFGLVVAWKNGIGLWSLPRHPLASWGAAALFFALLVTTLKLRWHARPMDQKRRLYSMLPHNARELRLFAIVALCAGIGEEIVYRGVFTSIIWWSTGNLMLAGLLSAIAF